MRLKISELKNEVSILRQQNDTNEERILELEKEISSLKEENDLL